MLKDRIRLITTAGTLEEVRRGLAHLARKRGLEPSLLRKAADNLPVEVLPLSSYRRRLGAARKRIGWRDPHDADLLALALAEHAPLWSQDKDFEGCGVDLFTTERLMKTLGLAQ